MTKPSMSKEKKQVLKARLEKLEKEMDRIRKVFSDSTKNARKIVKKAHERKDDNTVKELRKKMGL